jgi:hypothetical protein
MMCLRQALAGDWRMAKNVHTLSLKCRTIQVVLITNFKLSFYALGLVELRKRSQKIMGNFRRVRRYLTAQVVRVMPDFKAVVFVEGQLPFNVATPSTP